MMKKSDDIKELAVALAKVQAELKPAKESARNPFLKNTYADLGDVWDSCRDLLSDNGLSVAQFPTNGEHGEIGLTTILMHESGQWVADSISLPLFEEKGKSAAQVAGSVISYFRRYALSAVVGVVTGEDDDGTMGKNPRKAKRSNGSKPFYGTAAKKIPYYKAPDHVKNAMNGLGIEYPQTGQDATNALALLNQYADLRADGVEQDEAKAIVTGGMGQPDDAEAEKEAA